MNKKIITLVLSAIMLSGCGANVTETETELSPETLKSSDSLPQNISVRSYERDMFKTDTDYLHSVGTPDDVIESVKDQYYEQFLLTLSDTSIYYFIPLDIMKNYGTQKYRIYSRDKNSSECEILYTSSDDDTEKDLYSSVVYNGCLYWSESHYNTEGNPEWYIQKLDTSADTVQTVCSYTDIMSDTVPVLSCSSDGLYWYSSHEDNGKVSYNIMRYSDIGIEAIYENVSCDNPYTRFHATGSNAYVLKDGSFVCGSQKISAPELVSYYSSSDKYIVWEQLPEKDVYINRTLHIYSTETGKVSGIEEAALNGTLMGCGILGDYIYMNIYNGTGLYNGMYLLDPESGTMYCLNNSLNGETAFSWPMSTENGTLYFYGEKIYEISCNSEVRT